MGSGFFSASVDVVNHIANHCRSINWLEPLLAYLVLRKHAKEGTKITTAGIPAIAKSLGISHYKAELALQELQTIQVWTTPTLLKQECDEDISSFLNGYPVKVVPLGDGPLIYLGPMRFLSWPGTFSSLSLRRVRRRESASSMAM